MDEEKARPSVHHRSTIALMVLASRNIKRDGNEQRMRQSFAVTGIIGRRYGSSGGTTTTRSLSNRGRQNQVQLDEQVVDQIWYLLQRSHIPRVRVRPSTIPGAGYGVFYNHPFEYEEKEKMISTTIRDMEKRNSSSKVLCLYPGIYTPGLPLSMMLRHCSTSDDNNNDLSNYYFANQSPPSGGPIHENAYILNLQDCGGYIDGQSLRCVHYDDDDDNDDNKNSHIDAGYHLDENPSACGHLINHNSEKANVTVISFPWQQIIEHVNQRQDIDHMDSSTLSYPLPNIIRQDGTPWYYDDGDDGIMTTNRNGKIKYFTSETMSNFTYMNCGAAFVLKNSQPPLQPDDELLLDYKLSKPYPSWASDWYS